MANFIHKQIICNGEWQLSFVDNLNHICTFSISIENGQILRKTISVNSQDKLICNRSSVNLYSNQKESSQEISPPNDRLVLHVRRDKNEYPFLESLILWAEGVRGFAFATSPTQIDIPLNPFQLTSLHAVPSVLEHLTDDQLQNVLKKLEYIDYKIEAASTGLEAATKIVFLKEQTW